MKKKDIVPFSNDTNFPIALGLGLIRGMSPAVLSGVKNNAPSGTEVDMMSFTDNYVFPNDNGELMEVVGDNPGEISELKVVGLDEFGKPKIQTRTVNGLTSVPLSGLWSRINCLENVGSVPFVGNVSVRAAGGGTIFAQTVGIRQISFSGVYTVAANTSMIALQLIPTISRQGGSNSSMIINFETRTRGGVFVTRFITAIQRDGNSSPTFKNPAPMLFSEATDVKFTVEASSPNVSALVRMSMVLIENNTIQDL